MNADSLLKRTIDGLGVPVERLKYGGKADRFITYQLVVGSETHFADDESGAMEYTYQVHIFARGDYIDLLSRTIQAVKAAEFYGIVIDPEVYEQDTGYYHVPVQIKYMEV